MWAWNAGAAMTVVSPDAGRVRLADMWSDRLNCRLAIIHKRRDPNVANTVAVHEVVGEVEGKVCLLINTVSRNKRSEREAALLRRAAVGAVRDAQQVEFLRTLQLAIRVDADFDAYGITLVEVKVRFLHVVERRVAKLREAGTVGRGEFQTRPFRPYWISSRAW